MTSPSVYPLVRETLDIEAQAPVKVGKDEADMIKCLGPRTLGQAMTRVRARNQ